MSESTDTFKKAPRRKAAKGRSVSVSPEARQAYADLLREREAKQETYGRHLPPEDGKRR